MIRSTVSDHIENRHQADVRVAARSGCSRYTLREVRGLFVIETFSGEKWRSYIEPIARGSNKLRLAHLHAHRLGGGRDQDWMEEALHGRQAHRPGQRDLSTGKIRKGPDRHRLDPHPDTYYLKLGGKLVDQAVSVSRATGRPTRTPRFRCPTWRAGRNEFGSPASPGTSCRPREGRAWQEQEGARFPENAEHARATTEQ